MNEVKMLDEKQVAEMLGCSVPLVRKWRLFKEGPAYSKIGRLVRYNADDVRAFIEANKQTGGNLYTA